MLTPNERRLRGRAAANARWSDEDQRAAASEAQRKRQLDHFEDQVDPHRRLPQSVRTARARQALRAYMQFLSLRASRARREQSAS
jgi:hypothetical protein